MKSTLGLILLFCQLVFWSCNGDDKSPAIRPASELYLDYKISAEEAAEYAVALLYFRRGGPNADAIALEENSQVIFDGEALVADSARLAGVYYEVQRPLVDFLGTHKITYTDNKGQAFEHSFQFTPLVLERLPSTLTRQDLVLKLGESAGKGRVQVLVTDTSFKTADINEEYSVNNGQIIITKEALRKVASGPITLELIKEEVQTLQNGRLIINYTLRRELELK